jgi:hypothetical protein
MAQVLGRVLENADEQDDQEDEDDEADDSEAGAERSYRKCGSKGGHEGNTPWRGRSVSSGV